MAADVNPDANLAVKTAAKRKAKSKSKVKPNAEQSRQRAVRTRTRKRAVSHRTRVVKQYAKWGFLVEWDKNHKAFGLGSVASRLLWKS